MQAQTLRNNVVGNGQYRHSMLDAPRHAPSQSPQDILALAKQLAHKVNGNKDAAKNSNNNNNNKYGVITKHSSKSHDDLPVPRSRHSSAVEKQPAATSSSSNKPWKNPNNLASANNNAKKDDDKSQLSSPKKRRDTLSEFRTKSAVFDRQCNANSIKNNSSNKRDLLSEFKAKSAIFERQKNTITTTTNNTTSSQKPDVNKRDALAEFKAKSAVFERPKTTNIITSSKKNDVNKRDALADFKAKSAVFERTPVQKNAVNKREALSEFKAKSAVFQRPSIMAANNKAEISEKSAANPFALPIVSPHSERLPMCRGLPKDLQLDSSPVYYGRPVVTKLKAKAQQEQQHEHQLEQTAVRNSITRCPAAKKHPLAYKFETTTTTSDSRSSDEDDDVLENPQEAAAPILTTIDFVQKREEPEEQAKKDKQPIVATPKSQEPVLETDDLTDVSEDEFDAEQGDDVWIDVADQGPKQQRRVTIMEPIVESEDEEEPEDMLKLSEEDKALAALDILVQLAGIVDGTSAVVQTEPLDEPPVKGRFRLFPWCK